jgi:hypothetical protein
LLTDQCYHGLVLKRQAYRYRLSPTRREAALLRQFVGCSRLFGTRSYPRTNSDMRPVTR